MESASSNARFAALRHRNFTLLWSGLIVSNVGTWMQNVASGWLVLQLTNSPLWLGLLGLSFAIPMTLLPLIGGSVADRVNRIRLVFAMQTTAMLFAFALAALTWLGLVNIWHLLAASFLTATALAFDNPTRQALLPDLVPRRDLLNAISLNSATYNGAALVGPALAGALLGPLGAGWLFFLNGVSYLSVIFALVSMQDVKTHSGGQHKSLLEGISAGLSFAYRNKLIFALLILSAVAAFFGRSYQNLLPVFARDIMNGGPQAYGFLLSAAGAGALVGAFGLASIRQVPRQGPVMVVCGILFALALVAFTFVTSLTLGIILLFIAGISSTIVGTMIATFIQTAAPNEMRGRVMSLYSITLIGLPSLGALGTGASAEMLGGIAGAPRAVLIGATILGIVVIAAAPFLWRRTAVPKETRAAPDGDRINILLMGVDRRPSEQGPWQTDTMMIASFDPQTGAAGIVGIPRDLYVAIPGVGNARINQANWFGEQNKIPGGGPALAKQTAELNLGRKIHYYALVDFGSFSKIIDTLGGVDIDVPNAIDDAAFPTIDYRTMPIHFDPGLQHMDGERVLQYVRTRHQDMDFGRSRRQVQVMLAIRDRALKLNLLPKLPQLVQQLWGAVETDLAPSQILALAPALAKIKTENIRARTIDQTMTTAFRTNDGADVLWPDQVKIAQLLDEIIPVQSIEKSKSAA